MRGLWPDVVSLVRPPLVLCSGIQLHVLLSPYLCFITFLYFDLYALGLDASLSYGSFVQTKHVYALIHIRIKGEVDTVNRV